MGLNQERATILCVEDEADLRQDLADELAEAGYAVLEARNGEEALEHLASTRPDLILCDIGMPGPDGYEVLDRLRSEHPSLADVPFIFLTALADRRDVIKGKRLGADDYLVKPIDYDLMLATIQTRLRQVAGFRRVTNSHIEQLRADLADLGRATQQRAFQAACRTFDYIALGVIVLDASENVIFANRAAHALARDGVSLGGKLTIDDPQAGRKLYETINATVSSNGACSDFPACVSIPRPSGRRDLQALVFALKRGDDIGQPAAAIFLSDPDLPRTAPDRVLADLYGLTPTESRVAVLLAEGKRPQEITAELAISTTTVSFHIRNLLGKTGTSRQTDLIALLLTGPMAVSFANPR